MLVAAERPFLHVCAENMTLSVSLIDTCLSELTNVLCLDGQTGSGKVRFTILVIVILVLLVL